MAAAELTLHVKALKHSKQEFTLRVPASCTVAELQQRIVDAESIPVARQRLIHQGKVLKPDQPLSAYNVEDGDALHLIVRSEDAPSPQPADSSSSSQSDVPPPAPQMPPMQLLPGLPLPMSGQPFMLGGNFNPAQPPNGQPPDLGQLVSSVLSSIGLPIGQHFHQVQQQQQQQQPQSASAAPSTANSATAFPAQSPSPSPPLQPQPAQVQVHVQHTPFAAPNMQGVPGMPPGAMQMQLVQGPNGPMFVPMQQPQQPAPSTAAPATAGGTAQPATPPQPSGSSQQQPAAPQLQPGAMPFPFPFPMFQNGPQPNFVQFHSPTPQQQPNQQLPHSSQQPPQPSQQQTQPTSQTTAATGAPNAAPSGPMSIPPNGQPRPGMPIQLTALPRPVALNINSVREAINASAATTTPHARWAAPTTSPSFSAHHIPNLNPAVYPENVSGLISLLGQTRAVLSDAPASVAHVIAALQSQAAPTSTMSGADRNNVQRDAHQLGLYLRSLGNALGGVGQLLTHVAPQAPGNAAPLALAPNAVVPLSGPIERPRPPPSAVNQPNGPPQQQPPHVVFGTSPAGQQVPMRLIQTPNGPMWIPAGPPVNTAPTQQPSPPTAAPSASAITPPAQPAQSPAPGPVASVAVQPPTAQSVVGTQQSAGGFFPFPYHPSMAPAFGPPLQQQQFGTVPSEAAQTPQATPPATPQHPAPATNEPPITSPAASVSASAVPAPTSAATLPDGAVVGVQANPFAALMSQLLPNMQQAFAQQPQPQAASGDAITPSTATSPAASAAADQANVAIGGLLQSIGPLVQQVQQMAQAQQPLADGTQQQQQAANFGSMITSLMGAFMHSVQPQMAQQPFATPAPATSAPAAPMSTSAVDPPTATTSPPLGSDMSDSNSSANSSSAPVSATMSSPASSSDTLDNRGSGSAASPTSASSSTSSSATPDLSALMSTMLPMLGQMMTQSAMSTSSSSPHSPSSPIPASSSSSSSQPSLQDMAQQILNSPAGASMATSVASSSSSTTNNSDSSGEDDMTLLDMLLSIVTRSVGLADLLAILNGDLSSLDRTEHDMYDLVVTLLNEEDSPAIRAAAAQHHAAAITAAVLTPEVLATRAAQLRPGADPATLVRPLVEQSLNEFFDEVLRRHDVQEEGGAAAAALPRYSHFLRAWGTDFLGSVMDGLVREAYTDGIVSASALMERAAMSRLSQADGLGAMAPLVGGSIKTSLVALYSSWKQRQQAEEAGTEAGGEDEPWLRAVPEQERATWRQVVARDRVTMDAEGGVAQARIETKQEEVLEEKSDTSTVHSDPTKPPSSVYREGRSDGVMRRGGPHKMETDESGSDESSESLKRKMDDEGEKIARKK